MDNTDVKLYFHYLEKDNSISIETYMFHHLSGNTKPKLYYGERIKKEYIGKCDNTSIGTRFVILTEPNTLKASQIFIDDMKARIQLKERAIEDANNEIMALNNRIAILNSQSKTSTSLRGRGYPEAIESMQKFKEEYMREHPESREFQDEGIEIEYT